ncbi:MAG: cytochrome P450 [Acetobacteraceae bacterium]
MPTDGDHDARPILADTLPNLIAADMLGLSADTVCWLRECGRQVSEVWRMMPSIREYDRLDALCAEIHESLTRITAGDLDPDLVFFLATAGVETTASTIAGALDILSCHVPLQADLRRQPDLVPRFVDEVLRLAGPIRRLTPRVSATPLVLDGVNIPAGRNVVLHIERAHRDPAVFVEPDEVRPSRESAALLAFGGGMHACPGAMLGRAQIQALLTQFLRHFHVLPGTQPPRLTGDPNLRQYARLPIRLQRVKSA